MGRGWGLVVVFACGACGRIAFDATGDAGTSRDGDGAGSAGCALPAPWDTGVTYSRILHVAPGGSNANDGSAGAPLATIDGAAGKTTPGTRILVAAGVYPAALLSNLAGTRTQPIAITADPGAILDPVNGISSGLTLEDPTYVVVEGFTIRNAQHGVYVDSSISGGTPGVIIRGIHVESCNNDGIKLYWNDDLFIEDNLVDQAAHDGIFVIGGRTGVIARNHVDNTRFGIQVVDGSTDLLIQGNHLGASTSASVFVGGQDTAFMRPPGTYQASRTQVIGNIVIGGGAPQIEIDDSEVTTVSHNTFISPTEPVFAIVHENTVPSGGSRMGSFDNNLISFSTATVSVFAQVNGTNDVATFTLRKNLWWATDDPGFAGPTLPAPFVETGSIVGVNPQLTSDGHLAAGSPAIGVGDPAPGIADVDGSCFAAVSTPGADEP